MVSSSWIEARGARLILGLLGAAGVLLFSIGAQTQLPGTSPLLPLVAFAGALILAWLFFNEKYVISLAVLVLYLGLLDGYLKLTVGGTTVQALRTLLLFTIVAGVLARWVLAARPLDFPPLSGLVIGWVALTLVQVVNPNNGTLSHTLQALRPHLEFVPLFFFGFFAMRSVGRLRGALYLLLGVAAVNGIVSLIQFTLSPEQLAGWGPGYQTKIFGEGTDAARAFVDDAGEVRVRPFGLGSDQGFGGALAVLAIPAVFALIATARTNVERALIGTMGGCVGLALVTSQSRTSILLGFVVVAAYITLSLTSRRRAAGLVSVVIALTVGVTAVVYFTGDAESGAFDRYRTISPDRVVSTALDYRRDTFAILPTYIVDYPFGAGLGSVGPAGSVAGGPTNPPLNAESQFTFTVIELGFAGLIVLALLNFRLLWLAFTRLVRVPGEAQLLLAAFMAPVAALVASWSSGTSTAGTPGGPFLWFALGVGAWWFVRRSQES